MMADGTAIREALLRPPVPFAQRAAAAAPAPTAPPAPPPTRVVRRLEAQSAPALTNETMMADGLAIREALLKGPLPFAQGQAPPPVRPAPAVPQALPTAPVAPAVHGTDETLALQRPDLSQLLKKRGE